MGRQRSDWPSSSPSKDSTGCCRRRWRLRRAELRYPEGRRDLHVEVARGLYSVPAELVATGRCAGGLPAGEGVQPWTAGQTTHASKRLALDRPRRLPRSGGSNTRCATSPRSPPKSPRRARDRRLCRAATGHPALPWTRMRSVYRLLGLVRSYLPRSGRACLLAGALHRIVVPEPLATFVRDLIAHRHGHATLGDQGTSPWLFPGGQPGRPISACQIATATPEVARWVKVPWGVEPVGSRHYVPRKLPAAALSPGNAGLQCQQFLAVGPGCDAPVHHRGRR